MQSQLPDHVRSAFPAVILKGGGKGISKAVWAQLLASMSGKQPCSQFEEQLRQAHMHKWRRTKLEYLQSCSSLGLQAEDFLAFEDPMGWAGTHGHRQHTARLAVEWTGPLMALQKRHMQNLTVVLAGIDWCKSVGFLHVQQRGGPSLCCWLPGGQ